MGATCHMTNSKEELFDVQPISSSVIFGNGERLEATHVGYKKGLVKQKDGSEKPIVLTKVKYVPNLACILFSITAALENGCKLEGTNQMIKVKKGRQEYVFDHRIKKGKGILYGIRIIDRRDQKKTKGSEDYLMRSMERIHAQLGHPSAEITKATASKLNLKSKGEMSKCEHCDIAKMRKKNISKATLNRADRPGDRVYMDIRSIKYPSAGGSKFWVIFGTIILILFLELTFKKKSDLALEGIKLINKIKNNFGVTIKTIRCDNAGEN